jgi:hypothetical protein
MTEIPSARGGNRANKKFSGLEKVCVGLLAGSGLAFSFMAGMGYQAQRESGSRLLDQTLSLDPCSDGPLFNSNSDVVTDGRCLQTHNGQSIEVYSEPTEDTAPLAFVDTGIALKGVCRVLGKSVSETTMSDANVWTFVKLAPVAGVTILGGQTEGFVPSLAVHGDDILPYCQAPDEKNT